MCPESSPRTICQKGVQHPAQRGVRDLPPCGEWALTSATPEPPPQSPGSLLLSDPLSFMPRRGPISATPLPPACLEESVLFPQMTHDSWPDKLLSPFKPVSSGFSPQSGISSELVIPDPSCYGTSLLPVLPSVETEGIYRASEAAVRRSWLSPALAHSSCPCLYYVSYAFSPQVL